MGFKKIIGVLGFLVLGFMPKAIGIPLFQAFLINGKDTLTMWQTFVPDPVYDLKITSEEGKMYHSSCMSKGYLPTWKIENDSIFLIKLVDESDRDSIKIVDLKTAFKERCINGRVFGKEISYQIEALRYIENMGSDYGTQYCFTIKDGKIIDKGEFSKEDDDRIDLDIEDKTDWKNLPDIGVDRLVTVKIITNDKGELIDASIEKNRSNFNVVGEDVWKKEALRQTKLIPKWDIHYKCGQVIDKEREIEFLFGRRH
jgi:hypothetical protein